MSYRVELDLVLHFVPPMNDNGDGITFTRTIELPFPPCKEIAIHSKHIDGETFPPIGFKLKDIIWDADRQVFLATTYVIFQGTPLAEIPDELALWLDLGWKLGSYADQYKHVLEDDDDGETETNSDAEEDEEKWQTLRPNKRPKTFNQIFKGLIRKLAELDNNCSVAYAMAKTQQYYEDTESPEGKEFAEAVKEYTELSWDDQAKWRDNIQRRYPRLERLIPKAR